MTREVWTDIPPLQVLARARQFFAGPDSGYAGAVDGEGDGFVRFRTFRGTIAVSAIAEPDGRTRVRVSTLRNHPSIPVFLTLLRGARV
ncbi:MAG: hypothetical protein HY702_03430 [Gemmatimonadetes bacterium]|nr:hypothetical protein [Gemmatimonadota bacterium]